MSVTYVIENYINVDTLGPVSPEDACGFYNKERLYNERPSWPLRFAGKGAAADPEFICVDMKDPKQVTFAGIFNHNLTSDPERFSLKGCADACADCDWETAPAWEEDMKDRILSSKICSDEYEHIFPNSAKKINRTQQYFRFEFIDLSNPDEYIEIGEAVLGKYCKFRSTVYLQPGRPDGPSFYMANQETYYGQDWPAYLSYNEEFSLVFQNINDVNNLDELQIFLIRVQKNGGRFIIIPDDDRAETVNYPICYYVIVKNKRDFAKRLIHGFENDLREWKLDLKTLTMGIKLL